MVYNITFISTHEKIFCVSLMSRTAGNVVILQALAGYGSLLKVERDRVQQPDCSPSCLRTTTVRTSTVPPLAD